MTKQEIYKEVTGEEMPTQDELYKQFKRDEMPVFRALGRCQLIILALMIFGTPSVIWIGVALFIKAEITLLVLVLIIALVYNLLDRFTRKQFDITYKEL